MESISLVPVQQEHVQLLEEVLAEDEFFLFENKNLLLFPFLRIQLLLLYNLKLRRHKKHLVSIGVHVALDFLKNVTMHLALQEQE